MPYADVNGQRIFYEDSGGSGRPVILAHGFLMDQSMFDPQVAALAPEMRLIRWDERGFGRTEFDGKPFTYWDSADDCIGLLDHLGIEKAVVGGMSQGGFLSLRAALRHPDRVKALVLIDTQGGVDSPEVAAGNQQLIDMWRAHGPVEPLIQTLAHVLLGAAESFEPWASKWRAMSRTALDMPIEALVNRDDIEPRLGEIRCPSIVFHGSVDTAITFDKGARLAQLLPNNAGFHRVEGAAHAANLTHPHIVNPPLLAFLRTYA
jgi:pimeloyl-ACP methyl ester carboxylesterase